MKNTEKRKEIMTKIKNEEIYVEGFDFIEDGCGKILAIDVLVSGGESFPAPYSRRNLEILRENMLTHAKLESKTIKSRQKTTYGCWAISLAGAAGFVLVNTTAFGKELSSNLPSTFCLVSTVFGGYGAIKNDRRIANITRNATFAYHKNEINAGILENPIVYSNIDAKDRATIDSWLDFGTDEPIVIENIHRLKPETISTILKNIQLSRHFGMVYEKEQGFQKTLKQG